MSFAKTITVQSDICLNLTVVSPHDFIPVPPLPGPPPMPAPAALAIESLVNAWWPPGAALGSNKFTKSVFHNHMTICLAGHDCGKFIPHVQVVPAPNNLKTLTQIPTSSRKANFSASTVLMNGAPTACMTMVSWPPTPMTYCAQPVSVPMADAVTAYLNTVEVGMTLGDWLAGAIAIAAGMILEYALYRNGGGAEKFVEDAEKNAAKDVLEQITPTLVGTLLPKDVEGVATWMLKQAVGALTGAARIALTGEGSVTIGATAGGPFFGSAFAVGYTRTGGVDTVTATSTGNAGVATGTVTGTIAAKGNNLSETGAVRSPVGLGEASVTNNSDPAKGVTTSETKSRDPFNGFQNSTVTDTTGAPGGTVTKSDSH